jgi:wyosine [tRNA(Phe)-imidazoG37] synthetase (radical SAM superfamily)
MHWEHSWMTNWALLASMQMQLLEQVGVCTDFCLFCEVGSRKVCWEWVVRTKMGREWRFRSASGKNKDC